MKFKYLNSEVMRQTSSEKFNQTMPYPWINFQGLLTESGFEELLATFPDISAFEKSFKGGRSHDRFILSYKKNNTDIKDLIIKNKTIHGVILENNYHIYAESVILTTGTFLNGLIHIGEEKTPAGRHDEKSSTGLSEQLEKFRMKLGRLKTGTPPRLDGSTINYDNLEKQDADKDPEYFSFLTNKTYNKQIACSVTYTNKKIHEIIRQHTLEIFQVDQNILRGQGKGILCKSKPVSRTSYRINSCTMKFIESILQHGSFTGQDKIMCIDIIFFTISKMQRFKRLGYGFFKGIGNCEPGFFF